MKPSVALLATALLTIPFTGAPIRAARADTPAPFDNLQPSLALAEVMVNGGVFPLGSSSMAQGNSLGFVYDFAGNFIPGRSYSAAGQTLPVSSNQAFFSLLGTTFGGAFPSTFGLPNLQARATIGAGPGLPLGSAVGSATVTLTPAQVPALGQYFAAQPYDTVQPSLALTPLIAVSGAYPSRSGSSGTSAFLGEIEYYAGAGSLCTSSSSCTTIPSGWLPAEGQLLSISAHLALFSVLGTTYGGNGVTTFALPNLVGRSAIGADADNPIGSQKGADTVTINRSELPGPGEDPVSNDQPSLAVNYLIAISGIDPSPVYGSFNATEETLGEVVAFAGNFAPAGWALADGQLLLISEYPALFALIGTTYGGNGVTDFALPDLDGRTIIGASVVSTSALAKTAFAIDGAQAYPVGDVIGEDDIFLTSAEVPGPAVPEPATWTMMALGFAAISVALCRAHATARPSR